MTVSPLRSPLVVEDLVEALDALRARGLRPTSARRVVLESLLAVQRPVSADEIAAGIGTLPSSDLASVYRNLEAFERVGLVRHLHAGHGPGRYLLEGRANRDFLACEACGSLLAIDPQRLASVRATIRGISGFEANFSHFPIFGHCRGCAAVVASS